MSGSGALLEMAQTAIKKVESSRRERALTALRGYRNELDKQAEAVRLERLALDDLILKLARGGISAEDALDQWQQRKR